MKVHFVGAGPGAPDLLTLRGKALLEQADLIIYAGSLVNPALLGYARADCVKLDSAYMTLEEILDKLKEACLSGKVAIRLHSGDPSLYGAIREQVEGLLRLGIESDVCPGVSSLFAAASALNAEYTVPGVTQTLVVTRTGGRTPVPETESLKLLAKLNASLAIFLSSSLMEKTASLLMEGGLSPDTPAAIVYKASWPDERVIRCTLSTLAESGKGIESTALILVGEFLSGEFEESKLYSKSFSTGFREALT